ncbi:DUF4350 domain-containing protein [Thermoflavimicrobium daqui]|uniref:DUF4350 domain-containing protein n=1 Tax=Thermoflavimicrobium daqui TaxID=2137476 RepID=A0A364K1H6_9BACL|nr:DUF4350 domain-containing protein [Thermoflavimicrobium daqui]RAL21881.1 hypothetical protein DL897_15810 [Thermoflavimicrobium daqui]
MKVFRWGFVWLGFSLLFLSHFFFSHTYATKPIPPAKVNMEVKVGWNGGYKWDQVPVKVMLTSRDGQSAIGDLIITNTNPYKFMESDSEGIPVKKSVHVSPDKPTEVSLLVRSNQISSEFYLVFQDRSSKTSPAFFTLNGYRISEVDIMVGVLSDNSNLHKKFQDWLYSSKNQRPIRTYPLQVSDIPNQAKMLAGLDILVIDPSTKAKLSSAQVDALRLWVSSGGTLVVGGGKSANNMSKELESLLPITLKRSTTTIHDLKNIARWGMPPQSLEISQVQLKENSKLLLSSGSDPILVSRELGKGYVKFATYELFSSPMINWVGNNDLWQQHLIKEGIEFTYDSGLRDLAEEGIIKQDIQKKLPILRNIMIILIIYFFIIGPILYFGLAHLKKRIWAWVAVPCLSLILSSSLYFYGVSLRGDMIEQWNYGFIEMDESGKAILHGESTFLSQEDDPYHVRLPKGFAWPIDSDSKVSVQIGEGADLIYPHVGQWTRKEFYTEMTKPVHGGFTAKVRQENDRLVGSITNQTNLPLKNIHLTIQGKTYFVLSQLAPKSTREINIAPASAKRNLDLSNSEKALYQQFRDEHHLMRTSEGVAVLKEKNDIIGFTQVDFTHSTIVDRKIKKNHLYLVSGSVDIENKK